MTLHGLASMSFSTSMMMLARVIMPDLIIARDLTQGQVMVKVVVTALRTTVAWQTSLNGKASKLHVNARASEPIR